MAFFNGHALRRKAFSGLVIPQETLTMPKNRKRVPENEKLEVE